jgi:hypothetical protein
LRVLRHAVFLQPPSYNDKQISRGAEPTTAPATL